MNSFMINDSWFRWPALLDQGHTASGELEWVSLQSKVFKYYAFLGRLEKERETGKEEGLGKKEQIQGFCHVGGEGCSKVGGKEGKVGLGGVRVGLGQATLEGSSLE